jgi:prevent-host-death family protein
MRWQVQEAKQKLSELIQRAIDEGPQTVTRHGQPVVVVVSIEEYRRLKGDGDGFKSFLLSGPDLDALEITRSRDLPREIELE